MFAPCTTRLVSVNKAMDVCIVYCCSASLFQSGVTSEIGKFCLTVVRRDERFYWERPLPGPVAQKPLDKFAKK